jgi:hypothetical protein
MSVTREVSQGRSLEKAWQPTNICLTGRTTNNEEVSYGRYCIVIALVNMFTVLTDLMSVAYGKEMWVQLMGELSP